MIRNQGGVFGRNPTFNDVETKSLKADTVDINGGTIDDVTIGGASAGAGTFTTLTATGDVDIADKIAHTGDTNTAIRFPAADTVTVETAGVERLRISSSGNVGIGVTPSPWSSSGTWFRVVDLQNGGALTSFQGGSSTQLVTNAYFNGGQWIYKFTNPAGRYYNSGNVHAWDIAASGTAGGLVTFSEAMRIDSSGNVGIGTSSPSERLSVSGNVTISGSLSKGSGSFKIDHPIKPETHHLVHSFIEGPQADNLYRGKVALVDGTATVNLDEAGRMTEGTFVALNGNVQCFTTNEDGWTAVRGKVEGNILTIEARDAACKDTVSWLVIGERHDQHMIEANWTDDQGRIITEPAKEITE